MTTQHPEALRLAEELDDGYPLTGDAISAAAELRSQHARITELEAQLSAIVAGGVSPLRNAAQETEATHLRELAAPSTDQVEEILRERDDADDFIDALLDEVLGPERPEWSSAYGRADALNDVRERMTALHKPAVDKAWDRFQSAMEAPQQPAPSPVPAGWKLVPVEPTEEMLKAADDGDDAYTLRCFGPGVQRVMQGPYDHYCAMLDAAPTAQADTQSAPVLDYPPLPEAELNAQGTSTGMLPHYEQVSTKYASDPDVVKFYTADQMRAYVDADRAARAPADSVPPPAGATNTKTHDLLSTTVGLLMGYREGAARQPYKPGSLIAKVVYEVVDRLKDWPYPEPIPPAQAADSVLEDADRYRWLAAHCRSTSEHWGGRWSIVIEGPAPKSHNSEDDFDAAVDAARKQGGE